MLSPTGLWLRICPNAVPNLGRPILYLMRSKAVILLVKLVTTCFWQKRTRSQYGAFNMRLIPDLASQRTRKVLDLRFLKTWWICIYIAIFLHFHLFFIWVHQWTAKIPYLLHAKLGAFNSLIASETRCVFSYSTTNFNVAAGCRRSVSLGCNARWSQVLRAPKSGTQLLKV